MRKSGLTVVLLLIAVAAVAQNNRNQQVRSLNSLVDYMDEVSRVNMQVYNDIITFSESYTANLRKRNDYIWHVSVSEGARSRSSDLAEYNELHLDAEGFISDYESRLMGVIREKQNLRERLQKFPVKNATVMNSFNAFQQTFDSMLYRYKLMVDYVHGKKFKGDDGWREARAIIGALQPFFDRYDTAAKQLYSDIEKYYGKSLPPLKSQVAIRKAEEELLRSVAIADKWADELHRGDDSHRSDNDAALRAAHGDGKPKAEAYLKNTYGFNSLSNGSFPHSRYKMFYDNMPSTIFWYISDTASYRSVISVADERYNRFVNRYNWLVHYYNEFIECADGMAFARNMDYSLRMAGEIGADTAQNVLLKKPRIVYRFALMEPTVVAFKQPPASQPPVGPFVPASPAGQPAALPPGAPARTFTDTVDQRRFETISKAPPHHTVYLLDVSNSMREDHKLDTLKAAMKYLVEMQRPVDNITAIAFADGTETLLRFTPCDQKEAIYARIDRLRNSGGTNAQDAINEGYRMVDSTKQFQGSVRMVIITDGLFSVEKSTRKKMEAYQRAGVHLSILLLGSSHESDTIEYFEKLCEKGKGQFYDMRKFDLKEVLVSEAAN